MSLFDQEVLWRNALVVIPLALAVALFCSLFRMRPVTRHALWLVPMLFLLAPGALPTAVESAGPAIADLVEAALPERSSATVDELQTPEIATPEATSPSEEPSSIEYAAEAVAPSREVTSPVRRHLPNAAYGPAFAVESTPAQRSRSSDWVTQPRVLRSVTPSLPASNPRVSILPPYAEPIEPAKVEVLDAPVDLVPTEELATQSIAQPLAPLFERVVAWKASAADYGEQWRVFATDVRDAVIEAPGIPSAIWIGGACIAAAMCLTRLLRFYILMRRAAPAPICVVEMAQDAAASIGLRRTPEVVVTEARVPPMVWCGRRARLVLPRELWSDLDEDGRMAVLLHELAHLRRRDNLVCWLEMVIGCLFWWHPVVWWIRRRLREEADLCCDAWVTSLAPRSRRAYAQALLRTRTYINDSRIPAPVLGLGVTSVRTRRFARRLTMVMTDHARPRLSLGGIASTAALIAAGMMVSPALACNEEKKAACAPEPEVAPAPPEPDVSTFERHMRERGVEPRPVGNTESDSDLEERVSDLEHRLDRLAAALEKLVASKEGAASSRDARQRDLARMKREQEAAKARAMKEREREMARVKQQQQRAMERAERERARAVQGQRGGGASVGQSSDVFTRTYELPSGKLKDLTTLMARQDVPILVEPGDDSITVHGNGAQQMVFKAFVTMLNQEDQDEAYQLSEGKLKDLTTLMARSDVPIYVTPGETEIVVHGTDLEQLIFNAFVDMISGDGSADASDSAARKLYEEEMRRHQTATLRDKEAHLMDERRMHLEQKLHSMEEARHSIEHEVEMMMAQAEALMNQAEVFEDEGDELEELADEADGDKRSELKRRAREMHQQAKLLEKEADGIERQADRLEERIEEIEEMAEEIEEAVEEIEEADA